MNLLNYALELLRNQNGEEGHATAWGGGSILLIVLLVVLLIILL